MKLNKNSKFRVMVVSSFLALLALLGTAVSCPTVSENTNAATRGTLRLDFVLRDDLKRLLIEFILSTSGQGGLDYTNIAKTLGIDFVLNSSLTISMDGLASEVSPIHSQPISGTEMFYSGYTDFSVASSASDGFAVYLYGKESTNMVGESAGETIPALLGKSTGSSAEGNWWGYNLGTAKVDASTLEFKGIPAQDGGEPAYPSNTGAKTDLRLTFGTRVDMATLAPDTYTGTVNVHAVAGATATALHAHVVQQVEMALQEVLEDTAAEEGLTVSQYITKVRQEYAEKKAAGEIPE